jgi:predicted DNA-binding antitoxin AbrB/MazE fold protein
MQARPGMRKTIKAVHEKGIIRPLEPLELPEGSRLDVIIISHDQPATIPNAAQVLAAIAALPLEGPRDSFSGREHDSILYPEENN